MECNCRTIEIILAALVLVFYFWETPVSGWIVVLAAIALLVHACTCKNCRISGRAAKKR